MRQTHLQQLTKRWKSLATLKTLKFIFKKLFKLDTFLPAIGYPIPGDESRDHLWNKAVFTIRHIYKNYLNDYDWFFKADDDT